MALYNARGIVLRNRGLGEADRIITLFTREEGKVEAVARGARRPRSRLAGTTQPFTLGSFQLFRGKGLDSISQCQVEEGFSALRDDLTRMAYASYACELAESLTTERDPNEELFLILSGTLHLCAAGDDLPLVARLFELRALAATGYQPAVDHCAACGGPLPDEAQLRFAVAQGGVLCPGCAGGEVSGPMLSISRGTLETMRRLLTVDLRRALMLKPDAATRAEMEAVLAEYIGWRLERRLKSREFLSLINDQQTV
ncbi:MAG: DNA repair protein RecO [Chloroflexota bacterium]